MLHHLVLVVPHTLNAIFAITIKPSGSIVSKPMQTLLNVGAGIVALGCGLGFLHGVGKHVVGARSGNYGMQSEGRTHALHCFFGAAAVGGAAAIINYGSTLGHMVG